MVKGIVKKYWRSYWGKFHNDEDWECINCGHPAYRRWEKRYNGYIGFCTHCDSNWRES